MKKEIRVRKAAAETANAAPTTTQRSGRRQYKAAAAASPEAAWSARSRGSLGAASAKLHKARTNEPLEAERGR